MTDAPKPRARKSGPRAKHNGSDADEHKEGMPSTRMPGGREQTSPSREAMEREGSATATAAMTAPAGAAQMPMGVQMGGMPVGEALGGMPGAPDGMQTRAAGTGGGTVSADGADDETQQVLIELRVPGELGAGELFAAAAAVDVPGLALDASYEPVPMRPPESTGAESEAEGAGEQTVVVRATVPKGQIPTLEADPRVLGVWRDTPIAPFAVVEETEAPVTAVEVGSVVTPAEGLGTCAIAPCDCQPTVAKGNIAAVANYLGVDQIWADGYRGTGIVVGIVDGGITALGRTPKPGETAQIARVIGGYPADWGTTAAAWGNHGNMTSTDALGMAPDANIYDIRISGGGIQSTISAALAGYQWAINQHAANGTPQVLSNSWGIFQESWDPVYARDANHPFTRKVIEALDAGILVLFAAGNCGEACPDGRCGSDIGPGHSIWGANGHPRVMTVAAVNINDQYIGYSSEGPAALDPHKPDFCSVSHFQGYFASDSGTSAATPIASGVVALLKQANPAATQDQIKAAITGTATDIGPAGWDQFSGAGILRAKRTYDRIIGQGRLETFARGMDHALWHRWQTTPGGGWAGWATLSGWIDTPVIARNADGRLEAFAIGMDHGLWHMWQTTPGGGWSGWTSLHGLVDRVAAAQNRDGRLEVFARGMDGAVWHIWQTSAGGGWSAWVSLGGVVDLLDAVRNADGRLEVFARGMDGAVWHIWQTSAGGGWSSWASLGGVVDLLRAARNADGRLEVFTRGMDGAVWHIWQTSAGGGWSAWASLSGVIDQLAVGRNADGRLEVFARGMDQALWHTWQTSPGGGWSAWASLGGWVDSAVVGRNQDGRLETFVIGADHALWHQWQTTAGGGWSGWSSLGGWIDQLALGQNVN